MEKSEEIKKGLECHAVQWTDDGCPTKLGCEHCPYDNDYHDPDELFADALLYIRQLKAKLAEREKYAPPVTPGTPIFCIVYDEEDNDRCAVKESKVAEIWYNSNGWFFTEEGHRGPAFHSKRIGQTVFLDHDAAQLKCDACNKRRNGHD